jgi:hypothetical protein
MVYGIGYALSPTGILTPDRDDDNVSDFAFAGWSKQSGRKSIPLDNEYPGKNPQRTPNEERDDARVHVWRKQEGEWRGDDVVDRAYAAEGWEKPMLSKLTQNHSQFITSFRDLGVNLSTADLLDGLSLLGNQYFGGVYLGSGAINSSWKETRHGGRVRQNPREEDEEYGV